MADADPSLHDVFELERIRQLIELMKEHDLNEIDLRQEQQRIRLSRGGPAPAPVAYMPTVPHAPVASAPAFNAPAAAAAPLAAAAPADDVDEAHVAYIKSPMVGTFYSRANPNAEPFVRVGARVHEDTVVCIVEAMKVFNEIPAEISGTIVAQLLEDEEPVDFGRPLFKVDTRK